MSVKVKVSDAEPSKNYLAYNQLKEGKVYKVVDEGGHSDSIVGSLIFVLRNLKNEYEHRDADHNRPFVFLYNSYIGGGAVANLTASNFYHDLGFVEVDVDINVSVRQKQ